MGGRDVNDVLKDGASIEEILDSQRELVPRPNAAGLQRCKEVIETSVTAVERAGNAAAANLTVSKLMADVKVTNAFSLLMKVEPSTTGAIFIRLGVVPGISKALQSFQKVVKERAKNLKFEEDSRSSVAGQAVLKGLNPRTGLIIPAGWLVTPEGVCKSDGVIVAAKPMVMTHIAQDVDSGRQRVAIAWKTGSQWTRRVIDRGMANNHKRLIELAEFGVPVDSRNSLALSQFLVSMENANRFTPVPSVSRMGWVERDKQLVGFMLGEQSFGERYEFAPATEVDAAFPARFRPSGTWDGWCRAVRDYAVERPLLMLMLYAAASSPLLKVLGREGYIVDVSGESSRGKTRAVQLAASVNGGTGEENGAWYRWNTTMAALMDLAHKHGSVALCIDETKLARPEDVAVALYALPSGQEKKRSEKTGAMQHVKTWNLVTLTTGEGDILSFNRAQGAAARCITLRGAPFGEVCEKNRVAAEGLDVALRQHHGHLGPKVVQWLLEHPEEWPELRAKHASITDDVAKQFAKSKSSVGMRLAGHVAVLHLAADLVHALGVPGKPDAALAELDAQLKTAVAQADQPTEAITQLFSWSWANAHNFQERVPAGSYSLRGQQAPSGGWMGLWRAGPGWTEIAYRPDVVRSRLAEWGYTPADILTAWKQRGWMEVDANGKNPIRGTERARMLVLKRDALELRGAAEETVD